MRRRLDLINALAFAAALVLSIWGGATSTGRGLPDVRKLALEPEMLPETLPDGTRILRDAGGTPVPLIRYQRIASGTLIADRVLSDLCEPDRIVAFTTHGAERSGIAHRLKGKPLIAARAPLEQVLALKPDLLIVNNLVDPGYVAQLREHGVRVFDLGHMHGLETLLPDIRALGWLIGAPERAERYARRLAQRMERVAAGLDGPRPRAMYVSIYGDRMYGGAARTSYHDILVHAGLRDVAAEAGMQGWPEITGEQILALDPEVLVTQSNMAQVLCRHAGLERARPCRGRGSVVELEAALMDDPGPSILDATESLYDALWRAEPREHLRSTVDPPKPGASDE
jgi:iron complex transport system substrate-binding protein